MASTNKTTNYELSQFIETDKPGWLTDYNEDMRKIDSNMKAISDVAEGASGSVSSLEDRMTAAEGAITTNANDIDALEARADALEAQAQSTAGTIAGIQTEQITQNAGIEAATELGYNLARPYDSASTYAVGDYVLFQNTLYKCITAISTGEAFDPTKWLAIKATDEIAAGGYTLPIASPSTLGGVKVGSGLSIDALTGVLSASGGSDPLTYLEFSSSVSDKIFDLTDSGVQTFGNKLSKLSDGTQTTFTLGTLSDTNNSHVRIWYNSRIILARIGISVQHDAITASTPSQYYSAISYIPVNPNYSRYNEISQFLAILADATNRTYLTTSYSYENQCTIHRLSSNQKIILNLTNYGIIGTANTAFTYSHGQFTMIAEIPTP